MIRPVAKHEERIVYGITGRGLSFLGGIIGLLLAFGLLGPLAYFQGRDNAHETCTIQSRGLQTQRHLTTIMHDLQLAVELPPTAPEPAKVRALVRNLRTELAAYTEIESKQPPKRTC